MIWPSWVEIEEFEVDYFTKRCKNQEFESGEKDLEAKQSILFGYNIGEPFKLKHKASTVCPNASVSIFLHGPLKKSLETSKFELPRMFLSNVRYRYDSFARKVCNDLQEKISITLIGEEFI